MKKQTKKIIFTSVLSVSILTGAVLILNQSISEAPRESQLVDKSGQKKVKTFYKKEVKNILGDLKYSNYPDDFQGLIASGDMTILGTVMNLESYVYSPYGNDGPSNPFTMATIRIDKVLAGTSNDKTVKVLFPGGNISKKALLVDVATKEWLTKEEREDAVSEEVITVKESYSPLPQLGESMALILGEAPHGANNIDETYYMASFAGKGVFLNNDGTYEREPEVKTTGNGESAATGLRTARSANVVTDTDDEIMNKGMNDLVDAKS